MSYGLHGQVCHLFPRGAAGPCLFYIFPVVVEPLEFLLVVVVLMYTVLWESGELWLPKCLHPVGIFAAISADELQHPRSSREVSGEQVVGAMHGLSGLVQRG